jgi:hypothetical protein
VSRTDEKGAGASLWRATEGRADDRSEAGQPQGRSLATNDYSPGDEITRTRLITDLSRLICQSSVPEGARTAGLTLIGWLARRRENEAPHAIGVEEARQSERRIRAGRAKAR